MEERALQPRLAALLRPIRLVVFDVDGTLTDGGIFVSGAAETLRFDVRDGLLMVEAIRAGLHVAWITGRGSPAVEERARNLGVSDLHLRVKDKAIVLRQVLERLSLTPDQTLAMGDDLPDLALRSVAGCFIAPADACAEVLAVADHVTTARGGRGAVREALELLFRAQDRWDALVAAHGG